MQDSTPGARPIEKAREMTREVRDELHVAGGELNLSTTVLERAVPEQHKKGDVRKAMDQADAATAKVERATEDLHHVEQLLANEIAERERLERELARKKS